MSDEIEPINPSNEIRPIIRFTCKCAYCNKKFLSKVSGSTTCEDCIKECLKK